MVGVGIVGLGRWSHAHAQAIARSENVFLVNCFARTPNTRAEFRRQYAIPRASETITELMDDPSVEAVIVSTPNDLHVEHALLAVSAGKPVLIDKPVAVDMTSGLELLRASRRTGSQVGVGHHPRRLAGVRAASQWISTGRSGRVRVAHADFSNDRGTKMQPNAWHRSARGAEAGVLMQVGIHQVDNLLHLLGPAETVTAAFAHDELGPTMPDACALIVRHASGAISTVSSSWTTPSHFSVELHAANGNLSYRLDHGHWTSPDVDDHGSVMIDPLDGERFELEVDKRDPLRDQAEDLGSAVAGQAMSVGVIDGLRVILVVLASVRSAAAGGRPIAIADLIAEAGGTPSETDDLLGA